MKLITMDAVESIYACGNNQQVSARVVRHGLVSDFARLLLQLEKMVGTRAEDSYLNSVFRPFRNFRYRIASLPLPLSDCIPTDLPHALNVLVPKCRHIFPEYFTTLEETAEAARLIMCCSDAPLFDAIRDTLVNDDTDDEKAILVRRQPSLTLRSDLRRSLGQVRIEVITPTVLLNMGVLGHLIALGPLGWFPPHLRTAPRAHRLTTIRYDWLREQRNLRPCFISSSDDVFQQASVKEEMEASDFLQTDATMVFSDPAPEFDWQALHSGNILGRDSDAEGELTSARLLLLSGNIAVYIDSTSEVKSQVIDTSGDDPTARVLNEELDPGMFILLRTGGGGDLIVPVADAILGARAQAVRTKQQLWKSELTSLVARQGERAVVSSLQELGCQRASPFNLRNWMSDKSIRPEFDDDFLSVLLLCNLDSEFETFAANARLLDRVHRQAGFKIRRMLLDRVKGADHDKLTSEGTMAFDLPGIGGGSFTAYRIEEISPATFTVSAAHINHPFVVGKQWLG